MPCCLMELIEMQETASIVPSCNCVVIIGGYPGTVAILRRVAVLLPYSLDGCMHRLPMDVYIFPNERNELCFCMEIGTSPPGI